MMHNLYIEYTFLSNMYVQINVQASYFIFTKKKEQAKKWEQAIEVTDMIAFYIIFNFLIERVKIICSDNRKNKMQIYDNLA